MAMAGLAMQQSVLSKRRRHGHVSSLNGNALPPACPSCAWLTLGCVGSDSQPSRPHRPAWEAFNRMVPPVVHRHPGGHGGQHGHDLRGDATACSQQQEAA